MLTRRVRAVRANYVYVTRSTNKPYRLSTIYTRKRDGTRIVRRIGTGRTREFRTQYNDFKRSFAPYRTLGPRPRATNDRNGDYLP